jgi:exopolyphosphatase / guanosine-5'-triphosphate,3'-diphosphate pyrophosphatase
LKFAAIDIGSNAVRLLFCNVYNKKNGYIIIKSSLIRVPIRLGEDVFSTGIISDNKAEKLSQAMLAFKKLIQINEVVRYRVCATSAMREARNGKDVSQAILTKTGINIEIIDGELEAELIFTRHLLEKYNNKKTYLYIDVGGGSTELTIFSKGKKVASKSFNIGTIRLLQNKDLTKDWDQMKKWIKENHKNPHTTIAIGTGGNINKLYKLSSKKSDKSINFEKLKELHDYLNSFTYQERVEVLGLNPDRADVIIQASKIFLTVLTTAGIKKIFIPQIGLTDGIIGKLCEEEFKLNQL